MDIFLNSLLHICEVAIGVVVAAFVLAALAGDDDAAE